MPIKTRKVKDLEKEIPIIIKRAVLEINNLSDEDIISLWDFFKYLLTIQNQKGKEKIVFVTRPDSIIGQHRKQLEKVTKAKILILDKGFDSLPAG